MNLFFVQFKPTEQTRYLARGSVYMHNELTNFLLQKKHLSTSLLQYESLSSK